MNENFCSFTFVVEVMFKLRTFSQVLATVIKLFWCSILYFEMYINSLNVECKIIFIKHFLHLVYSNKGKWKDKTRQTVNLLLKFMKVSNLPVGKWNSKSCPFHAASGWGITWDNFGTSVRASFLKHTPIIYLVFEKKTYSYTWLNKMLTYSYIVLRFFIPSLLSVNKDHKWILQFWFLSWISEQEYEYFLTGMSENGTTHITIMKNWASHIILFLRSYTGSAEKGGYSCRTSVLCHI